MRPAARLHDQPALATTDADLALRSASSRPMDFEAFAGLDTTALAIPDRPCSDPGKPDRGGRGRVSRTWGASSREHPFDRSFVSSVGRSVS